MQIYFLYIKNLVDNLLDNFFCNFFDIDIFENFSENKIYLTELSDIFKYFFNFQFEEFLFFFTHFFNSQLAVINYVCHFLCAELRLPPVLFL